jgi:predicted DNA-binding protein
MHTYSFKAPRQLKEDFERLAHKYGTNMSDAIRQIMEKAVEQGKQQEAEEKKKMLNSLPPDQRQKVDAANKAIGRGESTRITY